MSDALVVALTGATAAALTPVFTLLGIWLERRVKHKNADAALETAGAAKETAEAALVEAEAAKGQSDAALVSAQAEMRRAVIAERDQASADWARFCDANDHVIANFREQVADLFKRIDQAEMRAEADRQARDVAEKKFRIAAAWMRRAIHWIKENMPGANYPPLPLELEADIDL